MERSVMRGLQSLRSRMSSDSGFTLLELIVAVLVFSIFTGMILATVIALAKGATRAQVVSESTAGVLVVFGQLDRQARYADSINYPGVGAGSDSRYIEFRTPGSSLQSGVPLCTQWRFTPSLGRIEQRQWNDLVGSVKTPWTTKLNYVIDQGGVDYPFGMSPAGVAVGSAQQQLVVRIKAGNDALNSGAEITTTYVARNSSFNSQSNSDTSGDKVSVTPVCLQTGDRP
jgi:prepilin-type N-terminal cleavage/methylation domain-containing protein